MIRPVDYDLIDRLESERRRREITYVCPFWDWIKDFRDHFVAAGIWDRPLSDTAGFCGRVIGGIIDDPIHDRFFRYDCDECSGEFQWR